MSFYEHEAFLRECAREHLEEELGREPTEEEIDNFLEQQAGEQEYNP